ncbi:MAG: phospholipase [Gammaproteobacteria bacterium]|jgi:phospholipase A1|nr:phospholipase [Gammaproteobacteria bacterium]
MLKKNFFPLTFSICLSLINVAYAQNSDIASASATDQASTQPPAEEKIKHTKNVFYQFLSSITGKKPSLYQKESSQIQADSNKKFNIILYQPTYILPAYYTAYPDEAVYQNSTPDNQQVDRMEFKGQLSFLVPLVKNIFGKGTSLNASYTQLSYWQFYAESQYFRETNYTPAVFFSDNFLRNWQYNIGVEHESNGRGGSAERSWNRAFGDIIFSKDNWMVDITPWILIFKNESSNLHNPDIQHYMGNGQILFTYKLGNNVLSFMSRNNLQSGFKRGAEEITWSHPIYSRFSLFVQGFSGFGQSLIEYNHYTNSVGVGFALNSYL